MSAAPTGVGPAGTLGIAPARIHEREIAHTIEQPLALSANFGARGFETMGIEQNEVLITVVATGQTLRLMVIDDPRSEPVTSNVVRLRSDIVRALCSPAPMPEREPFVRHLSADDVDEHWNNPVPSGRGFRAWLREVWR